ncbi:MAG: RNA polymerase sigma factor [Anaerolineae bacterium]
MNAVKLIDDQALLTEAQTSAEGFGRLFDRYYDPLLAYAYRRTSDQEVAQDIVAAVFEDALRQINAFQWRGLPLSAWLYRLAANKVADYFRAYYRRSTVGLDEAAHLESELPTPEGHFQRAVALDQLNRAIYALSETDQQVINLIYFDELSREEAALILDCRVDNVYVRLHRALKRLKAQLGKQGTDYDWLE